MEENVSEEIVVEEQTYSLSQLHVQNSLKKIEAIFEMARTRIDSLKGFDGDTPGEKIAATKFAKEIVDQLGLEMDHVQFYPLLKEFLIKGYPGVEALKGAHGGIRKIKPVSTEKKDSE